MAMATNNSNKPQEPIGENTNRTNTLETRFNDEKQQESS